MHRHTIELRSLDIANKGKFEMTLTLVGHHNTNPTHAHYHQRNTWTVI